MKRLNRCFLLLLLSLSIAGCVKQQPIKLPPVTEGWRQKAAAKSAYIVQKKDTLYSIAWAFGMDYRNLAASNNIKPPYVLHIGQRLYFTPSTSYAKKSLSQEIRFVRSSSPTVKYLPGWFWPTAGKLAVAFNNRLGGNKGIDIAGFYGQEVLASNHGIVVYSGTGIRSYGKLIIIKHNDDYLSAYAYNKTILVREGQVVRAGQKIAMLGYDNEGRPRLHFEIRRFGDPVNPLVYLPKKL